MARFLNMQNLPFAGRVKQFFLCRFRIKSTRDFYERMQRQRDLFMQKSSPIAISLQKRQICRRPTQMQFKGKIDMFFESVASSESVFPREHCVPDGSKNDFVGDSDTYTSYWIKLLSSHFIIA